MRCHYLLLNLLLLSACSFVPDRVAPPLSGRLVLASFYGEGDGFDGRTTANGERFNAQALTAAHRDLPFNTIVKVHCPATQRTVNVRINDRGPHVAGRTLDLSAAAAKQLGIQLMGVAQVSMEVVGRADEAARTTEVNEPTAQPVQDQSLSDLPPARTLPRIATPTVITPPPVKSSPQP